jgi:hypothetical protein
MSDAVALGSVAAAVATANQGEPLSGSVGVLGGILYVGSGVVVHGTHHQNGKAVASLLLRLGAPFVGAVIGAFLGPRLASPSTTADSSLIPVSQAWVGGAVGFGVGVASAIVVDDVFLSFERRAPQRDSAGPQVSATPSTHSSFSMTPYAGTLPGARGAANAAVGVTGRF